MAEGLPAKRRLGGFFSAVLLLGAWAFAILAFGGGHRRAHHAIEDAIYRIFSGFPSAQEVAHRLLWAFEDALAWTYGTTLLVASLALPLAFVVRMGARSRLRAGHANPLDRVRSWLSASRTRSAAAIAALPVLCQTYFVLGVWHPAWNPLYLALTTFVGGLAQVAVARGGVRALLAPTLEGGTDAPVAIGEDELRFNAVAVTRETWAAVGALATLSLGMVAWLASLPQLALFKDPRVFTTIGSYVAVAAASALLFRVASRISVGVDGVYVGGTSRARFYAYRQLDEARLRGGDIELVRGARVVLRLQLHGADALRRESILARIHDALSRVKEVERDGAAHFVNSRSSDKVASSLRGGGDYRMPSVSHDALWSLVEGAAVDAPTRTAAARALVSTGGGEERVRLRVAAAHCADPQVRVALERLARADGLDEDDDAEDDRATHPRPPSSQVGSLR